MPNSVTYNILYKFFQVKFFKLNENNNIIVEKKNIINKKNSNKVFEKKKKYAIIY